MKTFKTRLINARNYLLLAAFVIASIFTTPGAQQSAAITQPSPDDRIALYQALLDLTNPFTVMCVAAHPDDEDGTSLIVMRRKYGAHTVSLFSTFGEGGQNAIGPELYEELGAIRARETMAAAEIQGSEPHFLGLKDFGIPNLSKRLFKSGVATKRSAGWFWRSESCGLTSSLRITRSRITITVIIRPRRDSSWKPLMLPRIQNAFPNN